MFPVWLSPVQLRIVPVSEDQLDAAKALLSRFPGVRADVDDTGDTLAKQIRRAEKEWIPYIAVIGKKEAASGRLNVRVRATKQQRDIGVDELREEITRQTAGRPFKPLPLPVLLTKRPTFRG
jgi:threonyl-tRNA synthetase